VYLVFSFTVTTVSLCIQGGLPGAQKFSSTKKLVDLLKKQDELNKPYGVICASPAHVLEPHGLLKVVPSSFMKVCICQH
jgi:putative intracellular protease/amidase